MSYIIIASLLTAISAVCLVLWLRRTLTHRPDVDEFKKDIDRLQEIEREEEIQNEQRIDTTTWQGYWLNLYLNTGLLPKDESAPARTALIASLVSMFVGIMIFPGFGMFPENIIAGLVLPVGVLALLRGYYLSEARKRSKTLERQLTQLISSLRANLQANQTPGNAIIAAADEIPSPLGDELKLVREDIQVNVPLDEALDRLAKRVPSREIHFLVSAIKIATSSGQDLDPQLVTIQEIVDTRIRIRQKLASAVASVQPALFVSGSIIPGIFLFMFFSDEKNKLYWFTLQGMMAFVGIAVLYALGLFISKKLIQNVENT